MDLDLKQYDLLVVSDLHLSEGRGSGHKFSLNEDFFFDEEFARFLQYHTQGPRKWHLIINGDFLDFLQVVSTAMTQEFLDYLDVPTEDQALQKLSYDRNHREYGFGCGAIETVYKLWKIMEGHTAFFVALAEFLADGHVLTVGRGNHDVEFIYPEVQRAFAPKLRRLYDDQLTRENDPRRLAKLQAFDHARSAEHIRFMDWFYYEPELIWVEHGNQYDEANTFRYWLCPLLPALSRLKPAHKDEIDLPWGSFFVRYLFNKIENKVPFADNIKPQSRFIRWFLTNHFIIAIKFLLRDGRYMLQKTSRAWKRAPKNAYRNREATHRQRLQELATASQVHETDLLKVDSWRAPNVFRETRGLWRFVRLFTHYWRLSFLGLGVLFLAGFVGLIQVGSSLLLPAIPAKILAWPWLGRFSSWLSTHPLLAWPLSVLQWIFLGLVVVALVLSLLWMLEDERSRQQCYLVDRAREICGLFNVQYVTMGHTHDTDLQSIGNQGQEYFNTGTWTKVFSSEPQLVREENELVFLRCVRQNSGLSVDLMKWEDGPREPRLVKLFA